MNIHAWGYGGLLLVCAALYAWGAVEAARVEAKQQTVEARDATIKSRNETIAKLTGDLTQAKATNEANIAELEGLQADLDRQAEVSLRFEDLARARTAELNEALRRIADAPANDDGPVAPVLARELERLRARYAAAHRADQDPGRAAASPAQ